MCETCLVVAFYIACTLVLIYDGIRDGLVPVGTSLTGKTKMLLHI